MEKSSYQVKLSDAQRVFRRIICEQLHSLLSSGHNTQTAYNVLIQRITRGKGCHDISDGEILRVSKTHALCASHSKRALVVKGELRKLKSTGMNTLEAVSKLIKRMQTTIDAGAAHASTGKRDIQEVVANHHTALEAVKRRKKSILLSPRPANVDVGSNHKRHLAHKQNKNKDQRPDTDNARKKKPRL